MRILWLCNICLPVIAQKLGIASSSKEGWLSGMAGELIHHSGDNKIELAICFPLRNATPGTFQKGEVSGLIYYGFYEDVSKETYYEPTMETALDSVVRDFGPDLIHVFGTEFPHTLAMARAFHNPDRLLIGMQGICIACAEHFLDGIPEYVRKRFTFRDFLKQDNLALQQKKFYLRAEHERQAVELAGHITGRTDFDRKFVEEISPDIQYHFMNETLRSNFYQEKWQISECERNSIFLSQGDYPLKGMHLFLEALPFIKKIIPDVHVYIGGNCIIKKKSLKDRLKLSSYGKYLLELIHSYELKDVITFTGMLDAQEMCERMKKSHVFLSASVIENSPNSVGEAMLLGVPVVASEVGGVPDLLTGEVDGLLYPPFEANLLAHSIVRIFSDDSLACRLSEQSRLHAAKTHDPETNYKRLLEIYHTITASRQ